MRRQLILTCFALFLLSRLTGCIVDDRGRDHDHDHDVVIVHPDDHHDDDHGR